MNRVRRGGRRNDSYRAQVGTKNALSQPDSIIVEMPWTEVNTSVIPGAVDFFYKRYRLNSVFDPDFSIGGTSVYNFTAYGNLYRRYRVISAKVDVTIQNNEAFPVLIVGAPSDFDLGGLITSRSRTIDLGEMPHAVPTRIVGPSTGMGRMFYTKFIHLPSYNGNKQAYMADLQYSALNNTNPAVTFFWNMGYIADPGTDMAVGFTIYLRITYRVLWSERNFDITTPIFKNLNSHETESQVDEPQLLGRAKEKVHDPRVGHRALRVTGRTQKFPEQPANGAAILNGIDLYGDRSNEYDDGEETDTTEDCERDINEMMKEYEQMLRSGLKRTLEKK